MLIRTKKVRLTPARYVRFAFVNILLQQWWVLLIGSIAIAAAFYCGYKTLGITLSILLPLYWLFWAAQFYAVSTLEENKLLFHDLTYHLSKDQIVLYLTPKHGMPIRWPQIQYARERHHAFLLFLSQAQFIYLPYKAFHTKEETRLFRTLLQRKTLL